jgi:hypothetical protein
MIQTKGRRIPISAGREEEMITSVSDVVART